ncbi:MAG: hypothetical protein ACT4NL_04875 [Pseudomarimonas sp.]
MKNPVPLCMAIIDALLVFETSSAEEVDPDIAVRAMENMGSSLQQLDHEDQRELRHLLYGIAEHATDARYGEFVKSVPDMLGLQD